MNPQNADSFSPANQASTVGKQETVDSTAGTPSPRRMTPVGGFRPLHLVSGLAVIVVTVTLAAALGASAVTIFVVALVASLVVGTLWVTWETHRWDQAAQGYADAQSKIEKWQQKWHALHSDARQTTTAFSHMLDGLVMVSPAGSILLINESARRLLGLSGNADLLGRRFSEAVRVPEINRAVDAANRGEGHQSTNVEVVDGATIRPLRVQVVRITQADNSRMLLMLRDETEAKRVEEIRREFIANVSHELKTPLAAIKGYAETVDLAIRDDPEAALHFMSQINSQCLRLERLVADMMQLARAQSSSQFMKIDRVKMEDVIADALKSYRPVAEAKSIELTVKASERGAFVRADREALLTITNNLIGNAIRYTPDGGNVCVCCRAGAAGHWAMVVADDGVGIPLKDQDRIFERFYRVDKARESADGGTGIGLSIVKNLTLALHGQVAVTSSPNQGATFEVHLPATDLDELPAVGADHGGVETQVCLPSDQKVGTNA